MVFSAIEQDPSTIERRGNFTAEDKEKQRILLANLLSARMKARDARSIEQEASEALSQSLVGRVVRVYGKAYCFGPIGHPVAQMHGANEPIDVEIFVTRFGLDDELGKMYIEGLTDDYQRVFGDIAEERLDFEPVLGE